MTFFIRPLRSSDAHQINAIRRQSGVFPNTLGIPSERPEKSEKFVSTISDWDHIFVAVDSSDESKVLGIAGLHINQSPRLRHSAGIGISIHEDHHGKGIGTALMNQLIDLADNWLMLKRLELGVLDGNEKGLSLYKKVGFEIEGVKKAAVIRHGVYADEILMSRIRIDK